MPADIRSRFRARPGTLLVWSVMPGGAIIVRAGPNSVLNLAGMLMAPRGKRLAVKEMSLGSQEMALGPRAQRGRSRVAPRACLSLNGALCPTILPLFHGLR